MCQTKDENMKISNFRDYTNIDGIMLAKVDVESGFLIFKKKVTKTICRCLSSYWFFADTGEYTPSNICEKLERSYFAQEKIA